MRKPDFFIVGAPKCGTTAMDNYLAQHPEIFMAPAKESHYFAPDLQGPDARFMNEEQYLSLFTGTVDEKVLGESSVGYIYSELAATRIKAFNPDARIVIMLRNPVDVVHAYHSELLFQGFEEIESFEKAVALEPERKQGLSLPKTRYIARPLLYYSELGKFSSHVERFLELFGRRNVHVIIYDEFKKDTAQVYRDICEFLGVSPHFQPNYSPGAVIINSNKRIRSLSLSKYLRGSDHTIGRRVKALVPTTLRRAVGRQLWNFNIKYEPRPAMSPEVRSRLTAEFAPDMERLSEVVGHDLTHWSRS